MDGEAKLICARCQTPMSFQNCRNLDGLMVCHECYREAMEGIKAIENEAGITAVHLIDSDGKSFCGISASRSIEVAPNNEGATCVKCIEAKNK